MNDQELILWLENHVGFETYQHLGGRSLDRIRPFFLPFIQDFHARGVKIITIAGTNGKGQTSYAIASLLNFFSLSYGLFISPHVHSLTERLQTEKGMISQKELYALFTEIDQLQQAQQIKLSFFEFLFACFLLMCQKKKVPVLVLEVGVGGRLDATNLLDADAAIITSIGRDHQDLLGPRLENILREKMGIIRKNRMLFSSLSSKYLLKLCSEYCHKNQVGHVNVEGNIFSQTNRQLAYLGVKYLFPKLAWEKITLEYFLSQNPHLPGRGEILNLGDIKAHLFGSHNLDGMRAWLQADCKLSTDVEFETVFLAFSKRSWNDIAAMIRLWACYQRLQPQKYKNIVITTFDHFKAQKFENDDLEKLQTLLVQFNQPIHWIRCWKEYMRFLKIERNSKNILIIGSFYFVSEFKKTSSESIVKHP